MMCQNNLGYKENYFFLCLFLVFQEMFHKAEEFLPKTTDSDMDEMDTSDTQWGWFYLAECGKWHMFQVSPFPFQDVAEGI